MRIALFTYATQPRGGVLHTLALAEALHELGHAATVYALDDGRGFSRPPRCPSVRIPLGGARGDLLDFVRRCIATYVDAWDDTTPRYDIYHAHDGISGNALATLTERGRIGGFVRTVHHLDDYGTSELAALQDRSIVRARRWLAASPLWSERVAQVYGCVADVVSNGVDTRRFSPVPEAERARLREQLGAAAGPLFVTIGGIEPRKNTLALLEAFARLRRSQPAARLVIAGGASIFEHSAYRTAFEGRAVELGCAIQRGLRGFAAGSCGAAPVIVTGVLRDDEIVMLLRAAQAFVFPSLIEGFGLAVLEAAACGTPVITSTVRPFTDYLSPADALLVNPCDPRDISAAMQRALAPRTAQRAVERGPVLARRFTWQASARAHAAVYAACCEAVCA